MRPGAKAALAIWASAIIWDIVCPPGETFSEAIERGLNDKRTEPIVLGLILITTAHLLRVMAEKYDPYVVSFKALGRMVERNT